MFDNRHHRFPIVGVGASAGGLEALSAFLASAPPTSGMAFVLIQHLDSSHKSQLSELLGRASPIPVQEARDGQQLEPNQAYVLPAQNQITVSEGILKLEPRPSGSHSFHPIDVFFRSLADDIGDLAIGVVLSGTGSDGREGVAAIREYDGLAYAEAPHSAQFSEMPAAAIAAGANGDLEAGAIVPDIVSSLSSRKGPGSSAFNSSEGGSTEDESIRTIMQILYESKGLNLALYKGQALKRRVLRRMEKVGVHSFAEYLELLQGKPEESLDLYEDVLIKVTSFFRDKETFEFLKTAVLPSIIAAKNKQQNLKVWVPGCATGEEVYSIAICISEIQENLPSPISFEIFGTDISEASLARARLGEFDSSIIKDVSQERLERFFSKTDKGYKILPVIRSRCVFSKQNVAQDPPISGVDLISCRNLMIYFKSSAQRIVFEKFHYALNQTGRLVLGNSEDTLATKGLFHRVSNEHRIFEVEPSTSPVPRLPRPASLQSLEDEHARMSVTHIGNLSSQTELTAQVDQVIQSAFVPPGVVLNSSFEILQFRGDTSQFLTNPPGSWTNDIFKFCRDGLADVLHHLIDKVSLSGQRERARGTVRIGAKQQGVQVDLIPFLPAAVFGEFRGESVSLSDRYYIVLFSPVRNLKGSHSSDVGSNSESDKLRAELFETKGFLGSLMLQKQQAIEELRSANEEIHSANEELQSSNQELANAREESLIANGELRKVNEELRSSASRLEQLNSEISNLLGSLVIPVVIISEDFRIKLFTEPAERLFNLTSASRGESIAKLTEQTGLQSIQPIIEDVVRNLSYRECEILASDGRWYTMRARPYRTETNQVHGVVLAFFDVSEIKKSHQTMQSERDLSAAIIMRSPSPLLVLDGTFRIVSTNSAFDALFGVDSKEFVGVPVFSLWGARWNSTPLRQLIQSDWESDTQLSDFPLREEFPLDQGMHVTLSTSKIKAETPEGSRYILSFSDVGVERALRESAEQSWAAALAANQAKSEFLANMSHEMRSPLMAIMGFSETISDSTLSENDRRDFAARIIRNGEDLIELIDEILDLSKIEAGKFTMEPVEFELAPLLEESLGLLKTRAGQSNVKLDVKFAGTIPGRIVSCPRRVRQIIQNVVGNAIKFTEQKGEVTVEISSKDLELRIDVTDSGCGIAASKQRELFRPFAQADTSISRRYGGTGLGLTLSRQLARAMGGDVILVQSSEGVGSVFRITIGTGSSDKGTSLKIPGDFLQEQNPGSSEAIVPLKANTRLAGKRILLVEDSPDNQKIIGLFLKQSGATVSFATDGFEAISSVTASVGDAAFDLVLMDVQMPGLDGYSATRRLRELGYTLPVVALTANAMLGEHERALEAGCNGYISKPVRGRCLIDTVERYLNEAQGCC
jgi:two-component system CheB/CheR fusion protein